MTDGNAKIEIGQTIQEAAALEMAAIEKWPLKDGRIHAELIYNARRVVNAAGERMLADDIVEKAEVETDG